MPRSSSYNAMPGTFVQNDLPAGRKSHLFQPPRTPSASSSIIMTRSNTSTFSASSDQPSVTSRKRSRQGYSIDNNVTPQSLMGDWSTGMDLPDSMARSEMMDPGSPLPFVNTKYRLAGGLDTPTATAAHNGEDSEYSEMGYRKRLSSGTIQDLEPNYFPRTPQAQLIDANGRPRIRSSTPQRDVFGKALGVVGGVVSKVWQFCTAGAFRGFYAGGGEGYTLDSNSHQTSNHISGTTHDSFWQESNSSGLAFDRNSTPVPGTFPEDINTQDFGEQDFTPPPAAKRRQMNNNKDDLARNWVMVSGTRTSTTINTSRPNTPASISTSKPVSRYSMPTASSARRLGTTGAAARPASRASAAVGLRKPALTNTRQSTVSHAGSPGLNSTRQASFASPRSPGGSKISSKSRFATPNTKVSANITSTAQSPASVEAQKWAELRRKEESEADESMRRFNAQLKAMIREGKEALGTKIEVNEDVEEDMGIVEDYQAVGKWT